MSVLLDIQGVAVAGRRDAWSEAVTRVCGKFILHFGLPADELVGYLDARTIGNVVCARMATNVKFARRTERELISVEQRFIAVIVPLSGNTLVGQAGKEASVRPGEMTLVDSARPCSFRMDRDCSHLIAHLPWTSIEPRLQYRALPLAQAISGGTARVAASLVQSIFENADLCCLDQGLCVEDALVPLVLGSVLGTLGRDEGRLLDGRPVLEVIQRFIEEHLNSSLLTPSLIADKHAISLRHLHRLFAATGSTVGGWIRQRRLTLCMAELQDPTLHHVSLTQISHRWGFSDSAHFSRVFKEAFGVSPSACRQQAMNGGRTH